MRKLVIILALAAILCGGCGPKEEIVLSIPNSTAQIIMRLIPAGDFVMGSPEHELDRNSDEGPQHQVTIAEPFYMGVYEVTQEQWEAVMGTNPSFFCSATPGYPVEQVRWFDILDFIEELNTMDIGTFRLPTEAEWEYACRAGSTTRFPWGDDPDNTNLFVYGWYAGSSFSATNPVGEKLPNTWGLYDMHGNVFEWCNDWYGAYDNASQTDPLGPTTGGYRVIRGGSWSTIAKYCRSAYRTYGDPYAYWHQVGFRLVRTAP